ncbi:MAG: Cof-type HAD-IIB family hydrolase [Bacillota bacterium]
MNYNMVFSDIDGTLLNRDHQITEKTRNSIRMLDQGGVPFILVSARMPQGIIPLQNHLGINAPIVCFGGALILDAAKCNGTREILDESMIETGLASQLYRLVHEHFPEINFSLYTKDQWLVHSPAELWIAQEQAITKIEPHAYNFESIASSEISINKILCIGYPERIVALQELLSEQHPSLTIYRSKPEYLEIMAAGVSKSKAMETLVKRFKTEESMTLAIGDNYNDIDMIKSAGLGVAMGNSPEEVKAVADYISGTNDQDGVAHAIKKYFYFLERG